MPRVKWVMLYGFRSKLHTLSSSAKIFENRLRFDKVTKSLEMGTFMVEIMTSPQMISKFDNNFLPGQE